MFYFAYGSNMNHQQLLKERAPGARFIGPAMLSGYWLVFDGYSSLWGGPVANVIPSPGDEVWGGLFELGEEDLQKLDQCEGCPRYYSRREVTIQRPGREKVTAWIYQRPAQAPGVPSRRYLGQILQGARDCHVPGDYILSVLDVYPEDPGETPAP